MRLPISLLCANLSPHFLIQIQILSQGSLLRQPSWSMFTETLFHLSKPQIRRIEDTEPELCFICGLTVHHVLILQEILPLNFPLLYDWGKLINSE